MPSTISANRKVSFIHVTMCMMFPMRYLCFIFPFSPYILQIPTVRYLSGNVDGVCVCIRRGRVLEEIWITWVPGRIVCSRWFMSLQQEFEESGPNCSAESDAPVHAWPDEGEECRWDLMFLALVTVLGLTSVSVCFLILYTVSSLKSRTSIWCQGRGLIILCKWDSKWCTDYQSEWGQLDWRCFTLLSFCTDNFLLKLLQSSLSWDIAY